MWELARQLRRERRPTCEISTTRKMSSFDKDVQVFRLAMENGDVEEDTVDKKVEEVLRRVTRACDATMSRRKGNGNLHTPVYWLNNVIAELRQESNSARRLAQRARGKPAYSELERKFRQGRRQGGTY